MEQSIYRVAIYSIWRWPASLLYDNSFILPRCFFSLINSIKGKGSRAKPYNMGCWTSLDVHFDLYAIEFHFPQKKLLSFLFFLPTFVFVFISSLNVLCLEFSCYSSLHPTWLEEGPSFSISICRGNYVPNVCHNLSSFLSRDVNYCCPLFVVWVNIKMNHQRKVKSF